MVLENQKITLLEKTIFERVKFKPPLRAIESMEDEACLIYSMQGRSELYAAEHTDGLSSDTSVLMKCGSFINSWQVTEQADPYEAIAIHFYPDVIQLIFEDQIPEYLQKPVGDGSRVFQKIEKNEILKSYIGSLLIYFNHPELFTPDTVALKLKELIALLYQLNSNGIREILSDLFNPYQVGFKSVIKEHIFHQLTLEEYATLLNMSVSSFKRKFKELYGIAPGQYMQTKRLERAAQLLSTSSARVTEVCFDCGFGDISNFSKAFARKYGLPPSAYQNQHLT
ncbi:MAG TPA: hypothetical protein DCE41_27455 [Cytophagales bacterium]|nr:hypothetical protein [Cytophagales bacterium]HAA21811.1 hypothetical protein [Cytophagales bacterium]HAP64747.1 hypothetical protein [Cytophagales bacterium]